MFLLVKRSAYALLGAETETNMLFLLSCVQGIPSRCRSCHSNSCEHIKWALHFNNFFLCSICLQGLGEKNGRMKTCKSCFRTCHQRCHALVQNILIRLRHQGSNLPCDSADSSPSHCSVVVSAPSSPICAPTAFAGAIDSCAEDPQQPADCNSAKIDAPADVALPDAPTITSLDSSAPQQLAPPDPLRTLVQSCICDSGMMWAKAFHDLMFRLPGFIACGWSSFSRDHVRVWCERGFWERFVTSFLVFVLSIGVTSDSSFRAADMPQLTPGLVDAWELESCLPPRWQSRVRDAGAAVLGLSAKFPDGIWRYKVVVAPDRRRAVMAELLLIIGYFDIHEAVLSPLSEEIGTFHRDTDRTCDTPAKGAVY
eukprot:m.233770 g.233770  ORF g.233770 m.233770 type:complete len:368 (+) comp12566_c0_seq1:134-1237(+)